MSIAFANKTDLILASNLLADMAAASNTAETPASHARRLGDLARLAMLRGDLYIRASGASGTATIEVLSNGTAVATVGVDFGANGEFYYSAPIDLGSINGTAPLTVKVTCDSIGGADTRVSAWVEVEHPVIVGV